MGRLAAPGLGLRSGENFDNRSSASLSRRRVASMCTRLQAGCTCDKTSIFALRQYRDCSRLAASFYSQ